MREKLLILSYAQFGYLTDTLKYCQYAKDRYDITYIGWDYGYPKTEMEGVTIRYVSRKGNIVARNLRLLYRFHREIRGRELVFAPYFRGISVIRLLNLRSRFILDIRSLAVSDSVLKRFLFNSAIRVESLFFRTVSVISEGVARQLWPRPYDILPLGADKIAGPDLRDRELHLLYVGTLQNRDILKCVKGFHDFVMQTGDNSVRFTIVGDSAGGELAAIRKYIETNGLEQVLCTGRVPHKDLAKYFSKANAGVAFIPMTPYFDHQPPTKTFEYLLSGLAVIGTRTHENIKVLENQEAAILINDTAEDFASALQPLQELIKTLDPGKIAAGAQRYSWHAVVENNFFPLLEKKSLTNTR